MTLDPQSNQKSVVLWGAALLLLFLITYYKSVTGGDHPVSGSLSIADKNITYRFERSAHIKDTFNIKIRTDLPDLKGLVVLALPNTDTVHFKPDGYGYISASISPRSLPKEITYSVFLEYQGKRIQIPQNDQAVTTYCMPQVPHSILSTFYLTLYLGLFLAIRLALDYFGSTDKIKKRGFFALICFALNGLFLDPVKTMYERAVVDRAILAPGELFSAGALSFVVLWILALVAMFNSSKQKEIALGAGILTAVIFLAA